MIFRGAGCLSFFNTSYTILQFYHLQVQIKFRFLNPPNEKNDAGGRASGSRHPPLDELTNDEMTIELFQTLGPQGAFPPEHSPKRLALRTSSSAAGLPRQVAPNYASTPLQVASGSTTVG